MPLFFGFLERPMRAKGGDGFVLDTFGHGVVFADDLSRDMTAATNQDTHAPK